MSQQPVEAENAGAGDFSSFPLPDFLSEVSTLKPKLDSIFAEVEQNLPDIDFELSDVSSEEDVPIFHRALRTPTSEDGDDRELDAMWGEKDDMLNSSQMLEPLQVDTSEESGLATSLNNFAAMLGIDATEKTITSSLQSTMLSVAMQSGTNTASSSMRPSTAPVLREYTSKPIGKKNNWIERMDNKRSKIELSKISGENDKSISNEDAHDQKRKEVPELSPKVEEKRRRSFSEKNNDLVQQYLPTSSVVLPLDFINIDGLVSAALSGGDGASTSGAGDVLRLPHHEYDPLTEETSVDSTPLIQKLAEMTMIQSGTELDNIDPQTGALIRRTTQDTNKQNTETSVHPINKAVSMGTSTSDLPNLPVEMPKKRDLPEKETVYLDLRGFDKNTKEQKQNYEAIQRILKINNATERESSSSSSDDSGDEELMWHEQRKKIKDSLSKTGQLPHSLTKPKPRKNTEPETNLPLIQTHAQRLAGHLPPHKPNKARMIKEEQPLEPKVAPISKPPAIDIAEAERLRKLEIAKKVREEREREKQSRIRLGARVDALRPTRSIGGKHSAAENTPTLFDVEASYEPAPKSLPDHESRETVLLTVKLSCPGEIVQHRSSHKSVDTGMSGVSASYTSLVAWLLSLVGDRSEQTEVLTADRPVPFSVIGLQQMYINNQLCLYVAVVPSRPITGKLKKGKGTMFQQAVSKYLSISTLGSACPWLQALESVGISSQAGDSDYVYTPPLPAITSKLLSTFIQMSEDLGAAKKIFNLPIGYFWVTMETEEEPSCDYDLNIDTNNRDTQNTMSLIYEKVYRDPRSSMGILNRLLQLGLDLAGLRLLYPSAELVNMSSPAAQPVGTVSSIGPVLALAIRGPQARSVWLDALGPADPVLARRTDPASLCALFGGESRADCSPLFAPRNPTRVLAELARWFGGRVPASGVINVGAGHGDRPGMGKRKQKQALGDITEMQAGPVSCLAATVLSDVLLLVSPLCPPRTLGVVLNTCQRRGFQVRGIRRLRLNTRTANNIGLSAAQVPVFSVAGSMPASPTTHTPFRFDAPPQPALIKQGVTRPSATVLLLSKENASHTAASLIEAIMVQLCIRGVLGEIQSQFSSGSLSSSLLFHWMAYSDALLNLIGGDLTKTPDTDVFSSPGFIAPELYSNPELEQIVVLTFTGDAFMKNAASFLCRVLGVGYNPQGPPLDGSYFELLGVKWLPRVSLQHAKELTPHEVGTRQWKPSIHALTSEPAFICVLRGVNAFRRLSSLLNQRLGGEKSCALDRIMSPTPELAYRQVTLFFRDKELFPDNAARTLLQYLPPARTDDKKARGGRTAEESIIRSMLTGPVPLSTLLVVKPDALKRHLPKLLRRITQNGFSIAGFKHGMLSPEQVDTLIPLTDKQNPELCDLHRQYLTSGASLVLCLQRENAIKHLLDLVGARDPKQAKHESAFLWRAMFGMDAVRNGLHASSSYQASVDEIHQFFQAGLCCKPSPELTFENIVCPCEDPVMGIEHARVRSVTVQEETGSLKQTNVVILTPTLIKLDQRSKRAPYVDVIARLITEGFEIVGGRMIWFTRTQVEQYLHLSEFGSFALADFLMLGPCVVLALQRDNAVLAFDAHLGSKFDKDSVFSRYASQILWAKTMEQAEKQLKFFFDELAPSAQASILPNI